MSSVSQVGKQMEWVLEERACELARETGCVKRLRKFSGADLVQMGVAVWKRHWTGQVVAYIAQEIG